MKTWREQHAGRKLLRKTLEKLYDQECPESYCYNIKFVRPDAFHAAANNSPLYVLHAALVGVPTSDPHWLDIHRSYFEEFIEMVVHDVTSIHLMLCTFLPSKQTGDNVHEGWYYSLPALRDEWRRRYADLADKAKSQQAERSENHYRLEHAASDDSYFITDLADVGTETDVWNNCERVLVRIFMMFIDLDSRLILQPNSRAHNRKEVADKQRTALEIVRKYTPPHVRATCLVRCQRWDEAVQVLDKADASLDACMLAVMNDVWGLCPRYEHKDGLSVGVGAYVIKAFLSQSFPLLPACYFNWQPYAPFCPHAAIYVFVTLALCLDAAVMNRLKAVFLPDEGARIDGSEVVTALFDVGDSKALRAGCRLTQQLIGWLLLHVFDDPEIPRATQVARRHVIYDILEPILTQVGKEPGKDGFQLTFMFDYVCEIWKHCATHLEMLSRLNPIHLVEAGHAHFQSGQFDKWADCIIKALVFCVPDPSACNLDSPLFLVSPSFFSQERRAVLQEITRHLTDIFSVKLENPCFYDAKPKPCEPDPNWLSKNVFADGINMCTQIPGSGTWLKSGTCEEHEFANPKLQYIFQMLAVARAFQAHADGFKAGNVLDIITGRPEDFDIVEASKVVALNAIRCSHRDDVEWPSIIMPVVCSSFNDVSYFFTQHPRDIIFDDERNPLFAYSPFPCGLHWRQLADKDGRKYGKDEIVYEREADLSWLLPPFDEEQIGQCLRVPLHPAVCLHGMLLAPTVSFCLISAFCRYQHQPQQLCC